MAAPNDERPDSGEDRQRARHYQTAAPAGASSTWREHGLKRGRSGAGDRLTGDRWFELTSATIEAYAASYTHLNLTEKLILQSLEALESSRALLERSCVIARAELTAWKR